MDISVIGTGYVGLVTGVCFAELGMNVVCSDVNKEKIKNLDKGVIAFSEPGLEEMLKRNCQLGRLRFTPDMREAVEHGKVVFIAVDTPVLEDGSVDLSNMMDAAEQIASCMTDYRVIVYKSTVPIGTGRRIKDLIKGVIRQKKENIDFDIVSNPEFFKEGSGIYDFIASDRIVVGVENERSAGIMQGLFNSQILINNIPLIITSLETAEMIKYASSCFLAAKAGFINEIASICELCNADVKVVSLGMGFDRLIGIKFPNPEPGFDGNCYLKDSRAFLKTCESLGYIPKIIKSALGVSNNQKKVVFTKIRKAVGRLKNKNVTILGIAYKPETDDIRESPAISIINMLVEKGAKVKVFDPKAMNNARKQYPDLCVQYCSGVEEACRNSNCIILHTEWKQFQNLNFLKLGEIVKTPVFIDLRNIYEPARVKSAGFSYTGMGRC